MKKRIFNIIQIGNKDDFPSRLFDIFISIIIIMNITLMFMQTFDTLAPAYPILRVFELITLGIFIVEYALRIWTADLLYPKLPKKKAILKFMRSYDGVIDLLTILPFYYLSGFVAFRILRVVRIFHLFRINNQYDSFHVISTVITDKKNQIISSVFIVLVLMLASSLGMYSAEHEAQPEVFENAFSGIWWAVSTLLTVGYGDIYPITFSGRLMAILTAFLGVGVVAIPTGIISAGFVEQYTKLKQIATFANEQAIDFLTVVINNEHCWNHVKIKDAIPPQGFIISFVLRNHEALRPTSKLLLKEGDIVILATESYFVEMELTHHLQ